jgi:hypothetical protein
MIALDDPFAGTSGGPHVVQRRSPNGLGPSASGARSRNQPELGRLAAEDARRVIVIGSGPAGAIAALTLIKQGIPVAMLESGRDVPRGWLVRAGGRNVLRKRPQVHDLKSHAASGDGEAHWYE